MTEAVPQQPEAKRLLDSKATTLGEFFEEIEVDPGYLEDKFEPKLVNPDAPYLSVKMPQPATGALFLPSRRVIQQLIGDQDEGLETMKLEWQDDVYDGEYMLPEMEQLAELLYKQRLDVRAKVRELLANSLEAITLREDGKSIVRPSNPILFGTSPFLTRDELEVGVSILDRAIRPEDSDFDEALLHCRLGLLPILWKIEQLAKRFGDPHFALNNLQRLTAPYRTKIVGTEPAEEVAVPLPQIPWDTESQKRENRSKRKKIKRPPEQKLKSAETIPLRSEIMHARLMQMELFDYQIRNQVLRNSKNVNQFNPDQLRFLKDLERAFLKAAQRCKTNQYFQERWLYQLLRAISGIAVLTRPVVQAIFTCKGQFDSATNPGQLLEALKSFVKAGLPIAIATLERVQQPAQRIVIPPVGTVTIRGATDDEDATPTIPPHEAQSSEEEADSVQAPNGGTPQGADSQPEN